MDVVVVANFIISIGVIISLLSHGLISLREDKTRLGFLIGALGALFMAAGAFLLKSIPVFILEMVWAVISFYGSVSISKTPLHRRHEHWFSNIPMVVTSIVATALLFMGWWDASAYAGVAIYLAAYFLLGANLITRASYLFWLIVGTAYVVPHMYQTSNYAGLLYEAISGFTCVWGLWDIYRGNRDSLMAKNSGPVAETEAL